MMSTLITAAANTPGEVGDEIRATVYALVVMFMTSGPADQYQAEEWIHKAYRFTQRSRRGSPLLGLAAPLERMLQAPHEFLPVWEPLLTDDDPWVRALARLRLGKMRIMFGQDGRDADADLETALAEFRALGERWGISFALTELADRIATRGEFAAACEYFDQAIAVVTEVGAVEDVARIRARQAQLYWLLGDEESSTAAMAQAQRSAERVAWPCTLAGLALTRAELARWSGDTEQAHRQLRVAATMLDPEQAIIRATTHDLLGYLADSLPLGHANRGTRPGRRSLRRPCSRGARRRSSSSRAPPRRRAPDPADTKRGPPSCATRAVVGQGHPDWPHPRQRRGSRA